MRNNIGTQISVCLLTYNHVEVIESTLKSILDQTITDYEVIVSDDCSNDGTWELILELAGTDSRIKPFRTQSNLGMAGNSNFAVAQSKRPYIALLHHDDLCRRDLLEKWFSVIERYPETNFVFNIYDDGDAEYTYGPKFEVEKIEGKYFLENFLFRRWGCPVRGTAMIRRTAWDKVGGMRECFGMLADIDMWMRFSMLGPVGYVAEPVISVRHQRPDNYPEDYKETHWSWRRLRFLYEIHAVNRLSYLNLKTIFGRLVWWGFRVKLSCETAKWLLYAVVRKKKTMITTSHGSVTPYDLWPLRLLRWILLKSYINK
ncbi:MAG TPA: glycosyltransferase family 2 protein [Methylotenera sp.]